MQNLWHPTETKQFGQSHRGHDQEEGSWIHLIFWATDEDEICHYVQWQRRQHVGLEARLKVVPFDVVSFRHQLALEDKSKVTVVEDRVDDETNVKKPIDGIRVKKANRNGMVQAL